VGYCGGKSPNPGYHDLNGHSETVQLDFDPERISYDKLLDIFWHSHSPDQRPWSRQYASIIFYHNAEQKRLAEETKFHREESARKVKLYTEILPYPVFHLAEDYHQKYWLQQSGGLIRDFRQIYPKFQEIVNSTAAARVNGILGGYGTLNGTAEELSSYGLSPEGNQIILAILRKARLQEERLSV
jgi:peptide-methionine (S)-S-oxide reductase